VERAVVLVFAEAATDLVGIERVVLRGADVVVRIEAWALTDPFARAPPAAKAVAEASDSAQIAMLRVNDFGLREFMRGSPCTQYVRSVLPANTMPRGIPDIADAAIARSASIPDSFERRVETGRP